MAGSTFSAPTRNLAGRSYLGLDLGGPQAQRQGAGGGARCDRQGDLLLLAGREPQIHDGLLLPGDCVRSRVRAGEEAVVLHRDGQCRLGIEDHALVGRNDDLVVGHPPEHGGEGDGHHAQTGKDNGKQSGWAPRRGRARRAAAQALRLHQAPDDENDEGDAHEREGHAGTVAQVAALEDGGQDHRQGQADDKRRRQDPGPSASAGGGRARAAAAPAAAGSAALPTVGREPDLLGGRHGRHWPSRVRRDESLRPFAQPRVRPLQVTLPVELENGLRGYRAEAFQDEPVVIVGDRLADPACARPERRDDQRSAGLLSRGRRRGQLAAAARAEQIAFGRGPAARWTHRHRIPPRRSLTLLTAVRAASAAPAAGCLSSRASRVSRSGRSVKAPKCA